MDPISLADMKYVLCPAVATAPEHLRTYNHLYISWRNLWTETLRSLGDNRRLYSEGLTRQDYIGALFQKEECFALCTFRWVYADEMGSTQDSYFANWPETSVRRLFSEGPSLIVCGNFCLAPQYRTNAKGFSAKDLLMGMIVATFLGSEAHCLSGSVRNNKGMNDVSYRWGATPLATEQDSGYGDAKVDLIAFYREAAARAGIEELRPAVQKLWAERVLLPKTQITFMDFQSAQENKSRAA